MRTVPLYKLLTQKTIKIPVRARDWSHYDLNHLNVDFFSKPIPQRKIQQNSSRFFITNNASNFNELDIVNFWEPINQISIRRNQTKSDNS